MRKKLLLVICLTFALLFSSCSKDTVSYDGIKGNWKCTEVITDGESTKLHAPTPIPTFECEDGVNCVLTNRDIGHHGTITEKDGYYLIDFDDSDTNMTAELKDDILKVMVENKDYGFIFVRK